MKHRLPTDEWEAERDMIHNRMREARDDAAAIEDVGEKIPKPDVMGFSDMFEMVAETIDTLPPDRALTISINAMRAARRRWGKGEFVSANMNALLMAHAYTGLMLTALGHPDFLTEEERNEQKPA